VSLLEAGLLRQSKAGQFAFFNALPQRLAQVFLQRSESHRRKYNTGLIAYRYMKCKYNISKRIDSLTKIIYLT